MQSTNRSTNGGNPDRSDVLSWTVRPVHGATVASFDIVTAEGVLNHRNLSQVALPSALQGREPYGLLLSGRGPIWLYIHLAHLAHSFAWLAVHDPRLDGAVVVERHVTDAPPLGEVVPLEKNDSTGHGE